MTPQSTNLPPGVHYSPSQVDTFDDCPRKWFFQTILRMRPEGDDATNWGQAAHKLVEQYLRTGQLPPTEEDGLHQINKRVTEYINKHLTRFAGRELSIEVPVQFVFDSPAGVSRWVHGIIDVVDPSGGVEGDRQFDLEIVDHKTMKSLFWALNGEQLKYNRQLLMYARGLLDKYPAKLIKLSHGQLQREGPITSQLSSTLVTAEHVQRRWAQTLPLIGQMDELRQAYHPRQVPTCGTPGMHKNCKKYGGCPFLSVCVDAQVGGPKMPAINPPDSTRRNEGDPALFVPNLEDLLKASVQEVKMSKLQEILKKKKAAEENNADEISSPPIEAEQLEIPGTEEAAAEEPAPKKRGRPRKKKADQAPAETKAPAEEARTPSDRYVQLFINCRPAGGYFANEPPVTLEVLLAPVLAELAEKSGKADWRFHDFAYGKGHILTALRSMKLPTLLVVDRRSDLSFALEALRPLAASVVEGF